MTDPNVESLEEHIPADDEFELELTTMAHGGSAMGKHDGRAIFVPYTIPGELITARVTQDKGRFANAEGVLLLESAAERVVPRCPHFGPGRCGGCHWQHIDYAAQLVFKQQIVRDQLARIGGFREVTVHPVVPSPTPWAYRSHVTFHVNTDGQLGFIRTDNQHIIPVEECHIIRPELMALFDSLDLENVEGLDRVRLQVGSEGRDSMIILKTTDDQPPAVETDMAASANFLTTEDIPVNLFGADHLIYTVKGRQFRVTAGGFFQVNLAQAEVLVEQVMTRLALQGTERVLDLYAGVGLFTAFIAEHAQLVTSVESYPPTVTDADFNLAAFENVDLIEGIVEDVLPELVGADAYDAVVLDPPRAGVDGRGLDALAKLAPARIVYVSCDLGTFARDAKRLVSKGYVLRDVQPVDMFPQTYHIELVATFDRAS